MTPALRPAIEAEVAPLLRLGLVRAAPVRVRESGQDLVDETASLARELAQSFGGLPPGEVPSLRPARVLYRAFGVDPTQTRPSSEALFRRAVSDRPLPRVNNAVDVCNLCSLAFLLPIGLYDVGKIVPPVVLRRGRDGESYAGIRKDEVRLHGRPVLADAVGPFGNPTSDSLRTSVDEGTLGLWMVIFAPAAYPPERMAEHVAWARGRLARHCAPPAGPLDTTGEVL
jgi:DNA/RNA-binding domain of Phe-tRNA-synthetase-like protein